ncbi:MAG: DoxX family membrane protein [Nitrososphaerota archaeon]
MSVEVVDLKIVVRGLAAVHILWGLSLLLEPTRYVSKPIIPALFASIHFIIFLLLLTHEKYGAVLGSVFLTYYWFFVKPIAPIAEPQTVGILSITLSILTPYAPKLSPDKHGTIQDALLRLGLAYPFIEWGLDAFRNPLHFKSYLSGNVITSFLIPTGLLDLAVLCLGLFEVSLSLLILTGFKRRVVSFLTFSVLIVFSLVAGYPLALPQNIALMGVAYIWLKPSS